MKILPRVLVISLLLLATGHARRPAIADHLHDAAAPTLVVAHRADWRNFPENSLPAIESAIAMNLEMVEIDVRRTKDGQFVLMHDETVDRTTTGSGRVADLALAEIRELRLRDGLGSPTGFAVPTLREALLAARGRIWLNLDKSHRHFRELLPVLEETDMSAQVLVKGPQSVAEVLAENGDLLPRVAYMPMANFGRPDAVTLVRDWVRVAKPCAIEFVFAQWTSDVAESFALCRRNGVRIWVNTLWPQLAGGLSDDLALADPEKVYGVLLDRGASMLQTDRPRELRAFLARRAASAH